MGRATDGVEENLCQRMMADELECHAKVVEHSVRRSLSSSDGGLHPSDASVGFNPYQKRGYNRTQRERG